MIGSIEAGGTKIVCAVSQEKDVSEIVEIYTFPTTTPRETMLQIIEFFRQYEIKAIGIGSFGPIDVDEFSPTFGYITNTPKLAWKKFDFLGTLRQAFDIPLFWTTDVNAAAYGELKYGAAIGLQNCIYLTVGTGIGGGVVLGGNVLQGKGHPEIGHIYVNQKQEDNFEGVCPYHKNCLEGLVSGPAIEKRVGVKGQSISPEHSVWNDVAYYLAQACVNYTLVYAPEKIIFGGGVMKQAQLFPLMRNYFKELMNGYIEIQDVDNYIVPCALPDKSGIIGGLALANTVLREGV